MSVVIGGTASGRTRSERRIGTLRPVLDLVGEDTQEYRIVTLTGRTAATVRLGFELDWRVTTGDPHDMDDPSETLPDGYPTRGAAVEAGARYMLLAPGEQCTYVTTPKKELT